MHREKKQSLVTIAACVLLALAVAGCTHAKPERERAPLPTLPVTVTSEATATGEEETAAEIAAPQETEAEAAEQEATEAELAAAVAPEGEGEEPAEAEASAEAPPEAAVAPTEAPTTVAEPTATPTPVLPPYDGPLYTVQPGDTLASIALMHASTVQAFMEANGLTNSADIAVGQELRLPPGAVRYEPEQLSTYVVQPGDTLAQIAAWHRMPMEQLHALNPQLAESSILRVGQTLTVLIQPIPEGAVVHTVQPGDSLASIAARYGVSVYALAQANYISDANRLDVGQKLVIPE